ncbi:MULTISPECIES: DUF47 domain-containing protein [unclassified Rothia (in: high G+C Gram-positive bacteria)]|uniref:DUF47 domain-containing protein n=1 Tax=unclassified Rothia (in: high G+C Gram-positive bacteria) TaxID=2689056 RepID=UPI00195AE84F|nr:MULTISPECIES: phosphate transport regulator [unclassified Rothia (in: high G+C Gram-positive bacteria)]MBM7051586.1 phosphate transport regulator [Rothia sp. ZJ1223]QRZ61777.1 phosphate transport regulator [Rothia sp. ZJ932]
MLQRIFPHQNAALVSLADLAKKVADAAALLSEMLGSTPDQYSELFDRMLDHETQTTNKFFETMTTTRSSFATPIPREDMYSLALHLNRAVEHLTSAAHILNLHKIDRFTPHATTLLDIIQRESVLTAAIIPRMGELHGLDEYWIDMLRITKQAARTAEVYDAEIIDSYKHDRYQKTSKFIRQLVATSNSMRDVSTDIGRIIVQES